MHENRSFDHYFGTLGGVNGFDTPSSTFAQAWPGGAASTLLPFHLDTSDSDAECTYDLTHAWQAQHASWNGGAMDSFVSTHVSSENEGPDYGTLTMGYYDSNDLPFYYDLVKNFTICDNYFCSVLGPTHPNRLMQMTGTLDPAGTHGGPILVTNSDKELEFTCSWTTMPEILQEFNVSWKVYNPHGPQYRPRAHDSMVLCKNVLMYFDQYQKAHDKNIHRNAFQLLRPQRSQRQPVLHHRTGRLRARRQEEQAARGVVDHSSRRLRRAPTGTPALGEWYTAQVLGTLMSNPEVWASTVLFIMYDENDGSSTTSLRRRHSEHSGRVRHGQPPAERRRRCGRARRLRGPSADDGRLSLQRRGWVCSDVLDHTSQLQFISERCWGAPMSERVGLAARGHGEPDGRTAQLDQPHKCCSTCPPRRIPP